MLKFLIFALFALAAAQKATFDNYRVYSILPTSEGQIEALRQLEDDQSGFSFWTSPSTPNRHVHVMVSPAKKAEFVELMNLIGTSYELYINNVQELIDNENPEPQSLTGEFQLDQYHTLEEIYNHFDDLAKQYPDKVEVLVGGETYEGRPVKGIKVSFGKNNPGVFVEGGIHAREWISPATILYLTNELLNSQNADVREMADRHDWYIFPVFNPDGFAYTHSKDRLWRKTRTPYTTVCYGADPNRNWGYKWMTGGASKNPCLDTYGGSEAFSEKEMRTMSQYIESIKDKFYAYVAFHSFSQLLLFPYGHTKAHLENHDELNEIGTKMINALEAKHGTRFVVGNIAETIYIATGSSMDWVKGTLKKRLTYTYELRDTGRYGFLLPANQIIPTGEEILESLIVLFKEAKNRGITQ